MKQIVLISTLIIIFIGLTLLYFNNSKDLTFSPTSMNQETNLSASNLITSPEENGIISTTTILLKTTLVAGGCFWCVEADLEKLPGVVGVVSGYAGGEAQNPTYENYIAGGHREVVEVNYDSNKVSAAEIAIYAIKHMDPTDGDGSFFDRGKAYAPALYYENEDEKVLLQNLIADIDKNGPYDKPLAVEILKKPEFWPAEDYHQNYYQGTLSSLKYQYYRKGSGRDAFIEKYWGKDTGPSLPWQSKANEVSSTPTDTTLAKSPSWQNYIKPTEEILKQKMDDLAFKVTQEEGTERAGTSPLDKIYERGIYVDILSGEPLFSSKDKYDSGTGWPSFTAPISKTAVTEHIDKKLFSTRTEIRSTIADNHLGHVFTDGPTESTGLRYCMNGVALRFIPEAEMTEAGYSDWLDEL
jgi:peptide methionine sulfoxide reductase msrA/msrB